MAQPCDIDLWVMKWRSAWPIFHGPVILLYILKTIWYMNIILWDYESVWTEVWPKINIGPCDLYFMVQWFCLISWRLFDVWTSYFGILSRYDPTFDQKTNVGHCDLYFIGQWFCVLSWRLFDVWISYFGIMGQYDLTFDLKINVDHCDLYFKVQWFCLIVWRLFLEDCFNEEHYTWEVGIVDQCDTKISLIKYLWVSDLYFVVQWFCLISWRSTVCVVLIHKIMAPAGVIRAPLGTCSSLNI